MVNIPLFTGFHTSQVVVWDFWTINSRNQFFWCAKNHGRRWFLSSSRLQKIQHAQDNPLWTFVKEIPLNRLLVRIWNCVLKDVLKPTFLKKGLARRWWNLPIVGILRWLDRYVSERLGVPVVSKTPEPCHSGKRFGATLSFFSTAHLS